jgi:ADP-ribosylation factor-like protein 2
VFANKTDVNGCISEAEIQEVNPVIRTRRPALNHLQGLQLNAIKTHKWHIIRCSAITGTNLQEGLAWVVQDAKARLFLY